MGRTRALRKPAPSGDPSVALSVTRPAAVHLRLRMGIHVLRSASLVASVLALSTGTLGRATPAYDFSAVTAILDEAHAALELRGSGMRVMIDGRVVYDHFRGGYDEHTIVPIASSSKTLSAAVILALVDDGTLSLEDPVACYIPSFNKPGGYAEITIRQCFSHTSGLPPSEEDEALSDRSITLAESADMIAQRPLIGPPGGQFGYGGLSMQVAGRCAEVASGKSWDELFREKICTPLGLTEVDFTTLGLRPPYRPQTNPRIAGGARCSLHDFAVFREMLRNRGVHAGRRVLSEAAVREMERDHAAGLPVVSSPSPGETHYGLGTWIDSFDAAGLAQQTTAAGAFGFNAWIDRPRRMTVTYVVVDAYQNVYPYMRRVQAVLRSIFDETPPSEADRAASLINLSTRTNATIGAGTLIAGFAVAGGSREVVLRGVGPGLSRFGVENVLTDPVLALFAGQSGIGANDNWAGDDGSRLGAFALTPGSADAVLVRTLDAGTYSMHVTPASGTQAGQAIAEIYAGRVGTGRLVNLSTRAALAADGTMVVGFVIEGASGAAKRMLIRAVGPSLTSFGVVPAMPDPELEVFDASGRLIAGNDQWAGESVLQQAFVDTGAFAFSGSESNDAALVIGLGPGSYTVHVRDVGAAGGVALAEVYEMP